MLGALLGGSLCASATPALAQWPPAGGRPAKRPEPTPRNRPTSRKGWGRFKGGGCTFARFGDGAGGPPRIMPLSPYPLVNIAYQREGLQLVQVFGMQPAGGFLDDADGPNAFATPQVMFRNGPDGTVIFGLRLTATELQRDGGVGMALPAIMAHEFAHIRQFRDGRLDAFDTVVRELQADFLAGWYMKLRGHLMPTDISPSLRAFFERGDFEFNSEQHHGTPEQRLQAVVAGAQSRATTITEAFEEALGHVGVDEEEKDDPEADPGAGLGGSLLLGAVACCAGVVALRGRSAAAP
jgi:hypothetical protein